MENKEKDIAADTILLLEMATRTKVSYVGNPRLGIFEIASNRRSPKELEQYGIKTRTERNWIDREYCYIASIEDIALLHDQLANYIMSISDKDFEHRRNEVMNGNIY